MALSLIHILGDADALSALPAALVRRFDVDTFDKFFNKHISKVVRIFVAPLLTLLCGSVLALSLIHIYPPGQGHGLSRTKWLYRFIQMKNIVIVL